MSRGGCEPADIGANCECTCVFVLLCALTLPAETTWLLLDFFRACNLSKTNLWVNCAWIVWAKGVSFCSDV